MMIINVHKRCVAYRSKNVVTTQKIRFAIYFSYISNPHLRQFRSAVPLSASSWYCHYGSLLTLVCDSEFARSEERRYSVATRVYTCLECFISTVHTFFHKSFNASKRNGLLSAHLTPAETKIATGQVREGPPGSRSLEIRLVLNVTNAVRHGS